jgi:hypothetical protein
MDHASDRADAVRTEARSGLGGAATLSGLAAALIWQHLHGHVFTLTIRTFTPRVSAPSPSSFRSASSATQDLDRGPRCACAPDASGGRAARSRRPDPLVAVGFVWVVVPATSRTQRIPGAAHPARAERFWYFPPSARARSRSSSGGSPGGDGVDRRIVPVFVRLFFPLPGRDGWPIATRPTTTKRHFDFWEAARTLCPQQRQGPPQATPE